MPLNTMLKKGVVAFSEEMESKPSPCRTRYLMSHRYNSYMKPQDLDPSTLPMRDYKSAVAMLVFQRL